MHPHVVYSIGKGAGSEEVMPAAVLLKAMTVGKEVFPKAFTVAEYWEGRLKELRNVRKKSALSSIRRDKSKV